MYRPTLRQLEYVVAVADTGQFGLAARRTAVSQPALSKSIKEVEGGLGVPLFDRHPRGATPTIAGQQLVERARAVLAQTDDLVDAAAALRDPFAGTVRLGAIPTLAPFVLPALVNALGEELPNVELRLVEQQTEELGSRLRRGELDLAIVALPYPFEGVSVRGLYDEPFVLVGPASDPLMIPEPILPYQVAREPLILLEQGHCLRDHALQACSASRETVPALEASSLGTLLLMVDQGLGATLLPAMTVPDPLPKGLAIRRFTRPVPTRGVALWWRPSSPRVALFERIGDLLAAHRPD
jgi:LysR family transcriptional regulator, hydrogen peroxide-inducible genes activator